LNVPLGAASPTFVDLPPELYDAIYRDVDPEPFVLELEIDRVTGFGTASLKVGDAVLSRNFVLSDFRANAGPIITAVGPSIANANATGASVSVHVREFRIYSGQHR
jgi:hypothetical protein